MEKSSAFSSFNWFPCKNEPVSSLMDIVLMVHFDWVPSCFEKPDGPGKAYSWIMHELVKSCWYFVMVWKFDNFISLESS